MKTIDLRSDTVTQPTPAMREAMAQAAVGDDVYGEDPTILRLQEMSAELLGKEAALFVASGTMGNLASILAIANRGDEVIMGHLAHTFLYEAGGVSALGGVQVHTVPNQSDGTILMEDLQGALRYDDPHQPISRLIVLENTHNRCGGAVLEPEYCQEVARFARSNGLGMHLDGARIFNAAAALGLPAATLAEPFDSVTFCLSKSLCAPVGSVICGTQELIDRAHRVRKQLGGGMRQAGVLAAAGILGITEMAKRLDEDHVRARRLAAGLAEVPGIKVDEPPASNMVYLTIQPEANLDAAGLASRLETEGVKVGIVESHRMRLVMHYWIGDAEVDQAVSSFARVMNSH